jgi:hypothetical protein
VNLFPCTLVYVDVDAKPGPNSTSRDPLSYVSQAICLNNSLRRVGMPTLTIMTNAPDLVARRLAGMPTEHRPAVTPLAATIELPKNMPFYAAHFKLDLMDQVAETLPADTMMLLLDADMVALLPLDQDLIERCAQAGLGVFDISDQVFPAYGSERVVADLEIVADQRLMNPRWYGGEFRLALVPLLFVRSSAWRQGAARKRSAFRRFRAGSFLAPHARGAPAWARAPRGQADREDAERGAARDAVRVCAARREELAASVTYALR